MALKKEIKKLEAKHGFRANPVLDQYFLTDEKAISRLIRYARIKSKDTVLEIGPGTGSITREIAKKAKKVVAMEKDKNLKPVLEKELSEHHNIEYIWKDCLETDLPEFDKVVSALPYSISAPVTFKILKQDFDKASLIYQREFGEKMVAEPGDSNYGRLSVMVQTYSQPKLREIIKRQSFYPEPDVDSAIITLKPKDRERDEKYDDFIQEIFRYRNKNLSNAVELGFNVDIDDTRKVKDLSLEELEEVFNDIKKDI